MAGVRIHEPHELRVSARLGLAVLAGFAAGALVAVVLDLRPMESVLLGYVIATLAFCVPLMTIVMRLDPARTEAYLDGMDPTRSETDIIVVVAAVTSLAGVAVMLLNGRSHQSSATQDAEAAIAVATVACGWLLLHTIFMLRYARQWYNAEPGCIDFGGDDHPAFSDFAYLSFTLGMTYQVSDTNLRTNAVRRIVLRHTLLSYIFGTVIIASTINLVIGLAS